MVRDVGSRLAGTTANPPVFDSIAAATTAGLLSSNFIDLKGLRTDDTIPRSIGEGGEEIGAKFLFGTAVNSGTANCKLRLLLVTIPRATLTFTISDANVSTGSDLIATTAHGLPNGTAIELSNSGGALPGGLAASTTYYVRNAAADSFQLSLTPAGSVIDITSAAGGGTHTITIIPTVIASSGDVPFKRCGAGHSISVRVNPLPESELMPRHRYLYAMVVPTANLSAGTWVVDLVNRPEQWQQFYPPAAVIP